MKSSTALMALIVGLSCPVATKAQSLPTVPIEPYLLTKEAGPYMILAHTFRGPSSEKYALALAIELRTKNGLPAYVLRSKDFPGRVQRNQNEAAVLVGNEKTLDDSKILLERIKKLHPDTLDRLPNPFQPLQARGLSRAIRTINPYVPVPEGFPRKPSVLTPQINQ